MHDKLILRILIYFCFNKIKAKRFPYTILYIFQFFMSSLKVKEYSGLRYLRDFIFCFCNMYVNCIQNY